MELLCIKTHSQKAVLAGNIYPLIRTAENQPDICKCFKGCIDVGVKWRKPQELNVETGRPVPFGSFVRCIDCNETFTTSDTWFISKELFGQVATEEEVREKEYQLVE